MTINKNISETSAVPETINGKLEMLHSCIGRLYDSKNAMNDHDLFAFESLIEMVQIELKDLESKVAKLETFAKEVCEFTDVSPYDEENPDEIEINLCIGKCKEDMKLFNLFLDILKEYGEKGEE